MLGGRGSCQGVGEIDFRRALRDADLPLTESDSRRIFAHFEVCVCSWGYVASGADRALSGSRPVNEVHAYLLCLPGEGGEQTHAHGMR